MQTKQLCCHRKHKNHINYKYNTICLKSNRVISQCNTYEGRHDPSVLGEPGPHRGLG